MQEQSRFQDEDLLRQLRSDENVDDVIRFLYRSNFDYLGRFVVANKGSWQDAEDNFQEVVLRFMSIVKAGTFRGESSVRTFLYALNRNLWFNELKKRGRAQQREAKYENSLESEREEAPPPLEGEESTRVLRQTIESMDDKCRDILLLFYYEGLSMKELLSFVPYENEQVVRNKKSKCLQRLGSLVKSNQSVFQQLKTFFHG